MKRTGKYYTALGHTWKMAGDTFVQIMELSAWYHVFQRLCIYPKRCYTFRDWSSLMILEAERSMCFHIRETQVCRALWNGSLFPFPALLCCFSAFFISASLFMFTWIFGSEASRRFAKIVVSVFVSFRMLFCCMSKD